MSQDVISLLSSESDQEGEKQKPTEKPPEPELADPAAGYDKSDEFIQNCAQLITRLGVYYMSTL